MSDLTTYSFYTDTYYGDKVTETHFPKWLSRATDELDYLTCGNIDDEAIEEFSEKIQKAVCALMDTMLTIDEAVNNIVTDGGNVASRSSGGESISYSTADTRFTKAISSVDEARKLEYEAIKPYLASTGLLYAGM